MNNYKTSFKNTLILPLFFLIISCQPKEKNCNLLSYKEASFEENLQYLLNENFIDTLLFYRLSIFQKFEQEKLQKVQSILEVVNTMNVTHPLAGVIDKTLFNRSDGIFTVIRNVEMDSLEYQFLFANKTDLKPIKLEIDTEIYNLMGDLTTMISNEINLEKSTEHSMKIGLEELIPAYYSDRKKTYLMEKIGQYNLLNYSRYKVKNIAITYEDHAVITK